MDLVLTGRVIQLSDHIAHLRAYIEQAIKSFEGDPADSDFQEGYLACLIEIRDEIKRVYG